MRYSIIYIGMTHNFIISKFAFLLSIQHLRDAWSVQQAFNLKNSAILSCTVNVIRRQNCKILRATWWQHVSLTCNSIIFLKLILCNFFSEFFIFSRNCQVFSVISFVWSMSVLLIVISHLFGIFFFLIYFENIFCHWRNFSSSHGISLSSSLLLLNIPNILLFVNFYKWFSFQTRFLFRIGGIYVFFLTSTCSFDVLLSLLTFNYLSLTVSLSASNMLFFIVFLPLLV